MNILVAGATGKTGGPLVEQLLKKKHRVKVIVRSEARLPAEVLGDPNLTVTEASLLELTDQEVTKQTEGCDAVVSCLGHVISFKGIYGEPRRLCTDATRRLCQAIEENRPPRPTRFILMNTVAVRNPDLPEQRTWLERGLLAVLRHILPPQSDNEMAAEYLHQAVGKGHGYVEWCAVRPDSLIDAEVSQYDVTGSPITGLLSGRPTARSNVAHFMTRLIEDAELWSDWKFKMPVIMNSVAETERGQRP